MNILRKVQLITLITIILSVSILVYIDSAYAVPPIERVPLTNLTVSNMDESFTISNNEQTVLRVEYQSNYKNAKYVILYQILNEKNQVVLLNWIEGFQEKLSDQSYVCGVERCDYKWHQSESYVCGDKICEGKLYAKKFVETSWIPTEPGNYEIVVFAWEAVDNPTALSPPVSMELTVIDE